MFEALVATISSKPRVVQTLYDISRNLRLLRNETAKVLADFPAQPSSEQHYEPGPSTECGPAVLNPQGEPDLLVTQAQTRKFMTFLLNPTHTNSMGLPVSRTNHGEKRTRHENEGAPSPARKRRRKRRRAVPDLQGEFILSLSKPTHTNFTGLLVTDALVGEEADKPAKSSTKRTKASKKRRNKGKKLLSVAEVVPLGGMDACEGPYCGPSHPNAEKPTSSLTPKTSKVKTLHGASDGTCGGLPRLSGDHLSADGVSSKAAESTSPTPKKTSPCRQYEVEDPSLLADDASPFQGPSHEAPAKAGNSVSSTPPRKACGGFSDLPKIKRQSFRKFPIKIELPPAPTRGLRGDPPRRFAELSDNELDTSRPLRSLSPSPSCRRARTDFSADPFASDDAEDSRLPTGGPQRGPPHYQPSPSLGASFTLVASRTPRHCQDEVQDSESPDDRPIALRKQRRACTPAPPRANPFGDPPVRESPVHFPRLDEDDPDAEYHPPSSPAPNSPSADSLLADPLDAAPLDADPLDADSEADCPHPDEIACTLAYATKVAQSFDAWWQAEGLSDHECCLSGLTWTRSGLDLAAIIQTASAVVQSGSPDRITYKFGRIPCRVHNDKRKQINLIKLWCLAKMAPSQVRAALRPSSRIEGSHLCGNGWCTNPYHCAIEVRDVNQSREPCFYQADRDAKRGLPISEHCTHPAHQQNPCLLRHRVETIQSVVIKEAMIYQGVTDPTRLDLGSQLYCGVANMRYTPLTLRDLMVSSWDQSGTRIDTAITQNVPPVGAIHAPTGVNLVGPTITANFTCVQGPYSGPRDHKEFTSTAVIDFMALNYIETRSCVECPICVYLSSPSSRVVHILGRKRPYKSWTKMAIHVTRDRGHPMFSQADICTILGTQLLRKRNLRVRLVSECSIMGDYDWLGSDDLDDAAIIRMARRLVAGGPFPDGMFSERDRAIRVQRKRSRVLGRVEEN